MVIRCLTGMMFCYGHTVTQIVQVVNIICNKNGTDVKFALVIMI